MSVVETNGRRAPAPEMPEWVIQANLGKLDPHEIANQWNMQKQEEFEGLCDSLRKIGLQRPITLYEGKILDGRNRYNACRAIGYRFKAGDFVLFTGTWEEAEAKAAADNDLRRHMTSADKAERVRQLVAKFPQASTRQIALKAGVSHTFVANIINPPEPKAYKDLRKAWEAAGMDLQGRFVRAMRNDIAELLRGS
jgi:hypothetical protein